MTLELKKTDEKESRLRSVFNRRYDQKGEQNDHSGKKSPKARRSANQQLAQSAGIYRSSPAMQVQEEPAPAITADQYQFKDGDFKSSPNILLPKGMTEPVFVNPETDSSETERESSAIQNNSADTSL